MTHRAFRLPLTRRRAAAELDAEMRFHLDERVDELVASGMPRAEADAIARARFGDVDRYRRETRSIDAGFIAARVRAGWIDMLRREARLALRALMRHPGLSGVAVLTLALGLGATMAVFTLLDRVVLHPLRYAEADRLVFLTSPVPGLKPGTEWAISQAGYYFFRHHGRSFTALGAYHHDRAAVATGAGAESVPVVTVSASVLDVLRIAPAVGRPIAPTDDLPGVAPVAMLAHDYWVRAFGADPTIVGRTVEVDGAATRIIGIWPRDVDMPEYHADIWMPLRLDSTEAAENHHYLQVIGRLAPRVSVEAAATDLRTMTVRFTDAFPAAYPDGFMRAMRFTTRAVLLKDHVLGALSRVLWLLAAAAALVLGVAGANVANIVLVRAESRGREVAVRLALGAERSHLALMFLTEGVALAAMATVLGAGLAAVAVAVIVAHAPADLPRVAEIRFGFLDFAVGAGLAGAAGVICGVLPLGRWASRAVDAVRLRAASGVTADRRQRAVRHGLVVGQIGLAIVLLAGAGLLIRSVRQLRHTRPGFESRGVLTFAVTIAPVKYTTPGRAIAFFRQVVQRVGAIPGVTRVGATDFLPLTHNHGDADCSIVFVESHRGEPNWRIPCVPDAHVMPGYFAALGIAVRGREARDSTEVVVGRAFADREWPGQDPIGQGVKRNGWAPPYYHVVGVAGDVHATRLDQPATQLVYYRFDAPLGGVTTAMQLVVRTALADPQRLVPAIRAVVAAVDPTAPVDEVRTMRGVVDDSMVRLTFTMTVLALAAGIALALSLVGLYGVIAYLVATRRSEIGIRMALGARATQVARMVVLQSLTLAGVGVAVGVVSAIATTRVLGSLLVGVTPTDPLTLAAVALGAMIASTVASIIPARRAAAVDPARTLQAQ